MRDIIAVFSLTNKNAVKLGIKVSISVWGGLIIALLMNFEHPVWVMITGVISFFGNDNGQVLKKCLAQLLATVSGGVIGLVVMAFTMDSPLAAVICTAIIIFILSGVATNTRDMNITFLFAFSSVTLCIMTLIPVISGGTGEALITVFVDRIGTVVFGVLWVALVCSLVFPVSSKNIIQFELNNLKAFFADLIQSHNFSDAAFTELNKKISFIHDLANNSEWESSYSRKYCNYAREICNRIAELFMMLKIVSENAPALLSEISDFYHHQVSNSGRANADFYIEQYQQGGANYAVGNADAHRQDEYAFYYSHFLSALVKINELTDIYKKKVKKTHYPSLKYKFLKPFDFSNFYRNGARTALLFLVTYYIWYVSSWPEMFLMCIVPVVFSVMFSRLPHPEVITGMAVRGLIIAVVLGSLIYIITAQLPGAIEIYILIAGVPVFFGFMGLSSLKTLAYSIGFNIGYMVTVLPENNFDYTADIPFLVLRGTSVLIGAFILRILFKLIPVVPKINHDSDLKNTVAYFINKIIKVKNFRSDRDGSENYKALTDAFHSANAAYTSTVPTMILSLSMVNDLVNNAEARVNLFYKIITGDKPTLRHAKPDSEKIFPVTSEVDSTEQFIRYYVRKYDVEYDFAIRYSDILRSIINRYLKVVS